MVPAWITAMLVKVISITGPAAYVHCISIIPCHLLPVVTGYLHRMTQRIGSIGDGYMQCIWLPWVGPIRMHLLSRSRLLQQYHEGMCRHLHLLDSWWLQSLRCLTDNGQQGPFPVRLAVLYDAVPLLLQNLHGLSDAPALRSCLLLFSLLRSPLADGVIWS